jgi:NADPH2:quinone reductase
LNLALLKGASIVGVFWGSWMAREPSESQQNFRELIQAIDSGVFEPMVTEVYALDDFQKAFKCISERRAKGKVVLSMA